jgi:hypothetical protein
MIVPKQEATTFPLKIKFMLAVKYFTDAQN